MHRVSTAGGHRLARQDYVPHATGGPQFETLIGCVTEAGFLMLGPSALEQTMDFTPVNDVGPVALFRVFFSDLDDLPWSS
jgi:hypothetical protein